MGVPLTLLAALALTGRGLHVVGAREVGEAPPFSPACGRGIQ